MFGWLKSRTKVETPTYSVEFFRVHHEHVAVRYVDSKGAAEFSGIQVTGPPGQLSLATPTYLESAELERVVTNLAEGLTSLGHEFVIYKTGPPEPVGTASGKRTPVTVLAKSKAASAEFV